MKSDWIHPTGTRPKEIMILGLGETKRMWADLHATSHDRRFPANMEVWTVNAGFRAFPHDLVWVMDDLEGEAHKWPQYGEDLSAHSYHSPIITSTAYPAWPGAVAYPFAEVCDALKLVGLDQYFRNSIPYLLAYCAFISVEKVTLLGCDYSHPGQRGREEDQANAEWWCGFLRARGIKLVLADDTTLMGARTSSAIPYGYRFDPRIDMSRRPESPKADEPNPYRPDRKPHGLQDLNDYEESERLAAKGGTVRQTPPWVPL